MGSVLLFLLYVHLGGARSTGGRRGEGVGDRLKRGIPSIDYNINKYENYNLARVNASGNDLYFMREIREKGRT